MTKQKQKNDYSVNNYSEANDQLEALKAKIFDSAEAKHHKIDLIKEAIESGQYQANSTHIAKSMYEFHTLIEKNEVEPA